MARKKKEDEKEEKKVITALDQIEAHLKDKEHKDSHYNDMSR